MRTDRELLELAAKAAGIDGVYMQRLTGDGLAVRGCLVQLWNPLTDDGDALRLAVKLSLRVEARPDGHIYAWSEGRLIWRDVALNESVNNEREAAMRRAIVNASAEIGAHPTQHTDGENHE